MKAYWTEGTTREISSIGELDEVIRDVLELGEPTMLFLERDDGSTLVLGLGSAESVLTYADPAGSTFHSLGDIEHRGIVKFRCCGQLDDFLAEMAVPSRIAVEAAHEFCATGIRPLKVTWEADW